MSVVDAGLCRLRPCPDAQLCEIELLRRALDRLPKFQDTVYRCMSLDSEDKKNQFIERWTDTQDAMTGFMSTTYRRKNARLYMKKGKPTIRTFPSLGLYGAFGRSSPSALWGRVRLREQPQRLQQLNV